MNGDASNLEISCANFKLLAWNLDLAEIPVGPEQEADDIAEYFDVDSLKLGW